MSDVARRLALPWKLGHDRRPPPVFSVQSNGVPQVLPALGYSDAHASFIVRGMHAARALTSLGNATRYPRPHRLRILHCHVRIQIFTALRRILFRSSFNDSQQEAQHSYH
ncbi:hypothetical protein B0H14DRAFT_3539810 [Mycena olivaceomarginata]|nr:hypothetical protein B0H14DRAFT_3539810 [Mycena olivaceomarginata]